MNGQCFGFILLVTICFYSLLQISIGKNINDWLGSWYQRKVFCLIWEVPFINMFNQDWSCSTNLLLNKLPITQEINQYCGHLCMKVITWAFVWMWIFAFEGYEEWFKIEYMFLYQCLLDKRDSGLPLLSVLGQWCIYSMTDENGISCCCSKDNKDEIHQALNSAILEIDLLAKTMRVELVNLRPVII